MASQLIIRLQQGNGDFACELYENFPSPSSAYLAIAFTDNTPSAQLANELKDELIRAILQIAPGFQRVIAPCNDSIMYFDECRAPGVTTNNRLLLIVSDSLSNQFRAPEVLHWAHAVLAVLPAGQPVTLPPPFNAPQAAFWSQHIAETVPVVFGLAGISDSDQKIFISYRRTDTEPLAEQLFDRLTHSGFEVFLDRFSINPGVHFQNRLYQELADKAMVLFLESANFLNSAWVQLEIDFVKKYRLGLLAVNINNAPKTPSIDDELRHFITATDFITPGLATLTPDALEDIVQDIKRQHAIALYRMKHYLNTNVFSALEHSGLHPAFDPSGLIAVTDNASSEHRIWTTPRPAALADYHYTDTLKQSHEHGIIVGPDFIESKRLALNNWLALKSNVKFFNEGQLLELADSLT